MYKVRIYKGVFFMSDAMRALFYHVMDHRVQEYLPAGYDHFCGGLLGELESAFEDTLTAAQQPLWKQWHAAQTDYALLYEQALFQAAFSLARELP